MARHLDQGSGGGGDSPGELKALVTRYLTQALVPSAGSKLSLRNSRELRTLAEAMDALLQGDLARCGDLLIQRFKAMESAMADSDWSLAKHLELIPESEVAVTSYGEREHASKLELRERKLRDRLLRKPPPVVTKGDYKKSGGGRGESPARSPSPRPPPLQERRPSRSPQQDRGHAQGPGASPYRESEHREPALRQRFSPHRGGGEPEEPAEDSQPARRVHFDQDEVEQPERGLAQRAKQGVSPQPCRKGKGRGRKWRGKKGKGSW